MSSQGGKRLKKMIWVLAHLASDVSTENKGGKSMWESLHTMMEAKCALKWLLEQVKSVSSQYTLILTNTVPSYNKHSVHHYVSEKPPFTYGPVACPLNRICAVLKSA